MAQVRDDDRLTFAIERGLSMDEIEVLIDNGCDVNQTNETEYTPLMLAADRGNEKLVKTLIRNKVLVNEQTTQGESALSIAVLQNHTDVATYLIDKGAKLQTIGKELGEQLCFQLAQMGSAKQCKKLIKEVNIMDGGGQNLLMVACCHKRKNIEKVAEAFIKMGVEVNAKDKSGRTALMYAVTNGAVPLIKTLLKHGADINATDLQGRTALFMACNEDIAKKLLENAKLDVNLRDSQGWSALMYHVTYSHLPLVRLFLKKKVTTEFKDKQGRNALMLAVSKGYDYITHLLVQHGVRLNEADSMGRTALMQIIKSVDIPKSVVKNIASLLVDKTANLLIQDNEGNTVFHLAAMTSNIEMINIFGIKKVSHLKNKEGKSPVDILSQNYLRVIDSLNIFGKSEDKKLLNTMPEFRDKLEKAKLVIEEVKQNVDEKNRKIAKLNSTIEPYTSEISSLIETVAALRKQQTEGLKIVIRNSDEMRFSMCATEHYNSCVETEVFKILSEDVSSQWKKFAEILMDSYPRFYIDDVIKKSEEKHDNDECRLYYFLKQWRMSVCDYADRIDQLKLAITSDGLDLDVGVTKKKIDECLSNHYQNKALEYSGSLTDTGLESLAREIPSHDHWKKICCRLSFTKNEKSQAQKYATTHGEDKEMFKLLQLWRDRESGYPTQKLARLSEALKRSELKDVAEKLQM